MSRRTALNPENDSRDELDRRLFFLVIIGTTELKTGEFVDMDELYKIVFACVTNVKETIGS